MDVIEIIVKFGALYVKRWPFNEFIKHYLHFNLTLCNIFTFKTLNLSYDIISNNINRVAMEQFNTGKINELFCILFSDAKLFIEFYFLGFFIHEMQCGTQTSHCYNKLKL